MFDDLCSFTLLTAAAAIRNASTTTSLKNHSPQVNKTAITSKRVESRHKVPDQQDDNEVVNKKDRNRSELMYEDEDDKPNEKLDEIILKEKERLEREKSEKKNSEKKAGNKKEYSLEVNKNKLKDVVDNESNSSLASTSKMSKNDAKPHSVSDESKSTDRPSASKNKRQSSPIDVPVVKRMKETKEPVYKPFYKLLEGVVLVISGIQVRVTISIFYF